jgi:protein-L-isoaspartate O-methyltransferase
VLEVGAGSGYAAAVIGQIAGKVIAVERHHELVELARQRMERLGYDNVEIVEGDGTVGWPEGAPFDAIVAAASGSHVPQSWLAQLKPGGRIVMPIGEPHATQSLVKVTKEEDGSLKREDLGGVRFVPLIGQEGFRDSGSEALIAALPQASSGASHASDRISSGMDLVFGSNGEIQPFSPHGHEPDDDAPTRLQER